MRPERCRERQSGLREQSPDPTPARGAQNRPPRLAKSLPICLIGRVEQSTNIFARVRGRTGIAVAAAAPVSPRIGEDFFLPGGPKLPKLPADSARISGDAATLRLPSDGTRIFPPWG